MHYEHHRYVGKVCVVTGAANGLGVKSGKQISRRRCFSRCSGSGAGYTGQGIWG